MVTGHKSENPLIRAVGDAGIPDGTRILVAVSGGADSVALLHAFLALAPSRGWHLQVGHVNHNLRREESAADELFVRRLANALELVVDVASVDTNEYAARERLSIETAARTLRYAALRQMLVAWPGDIIATGHTRDDQTETVLMRLLRGTGLTGLAAMRSANGDIVRPLLGVPREEVVLFLQRYRLPYRLDQSNRDPRYRRNRIRREIVPLLEREARGASARIARTALLLQRDADYLRAETLDALALLSARPGEGLSIAGWQSLHPSLRRNVLRLLVEQAAHGPPDLAAGDLLRVEEALLQAEPRSTGSIAMTATVRFDLADGWLRSGLETKFAEFGDELAVAAPGETSVPSGAISASAPRLAEGERVRRILAVLGPWHAVLDADVVGRILIRTRRPGDRIRPLGAPGSRKVQDVMVDAKVPACLRAAWPVLTDGEEIVWIPGVARGEHAKVTESTTRVLHLLFRPTPDLQRARIRRHFRRI